MGPDEVRWNNLLLKVGGAVLLNPVAGKTPYVAEIRGIQCSRSGDLQRLRVRWYYYPEEALGGRQPFHGEQELLATDHEDDIAVESVLDTATIHTLEGFMDLPRVAPNNTFWSRFLYRPAHHTFEPSKVHVYCKCEQPFNPDRTMYKCDECAEWYHPECIGLKDTQITAQWHWACPACLKEGRGPAAKKAKVDPPPAGKGGAAAAGKGGASSSKAGAAAGKGPDPSPVGKGGASSSRSGAAAAAGKGPDPPSAGKGGATSSKAGAAAGKGPDPSPVGKGGASSSRSGAAAAGKGPDPPSAGKGGASSSKAGAAAAAGAKGGGGAAGKGGASSSKSGATAAAAAGKSSAAAGGGKGGGSSSKSSRAR